MNKTVEELQQIISGLESGIDGYINDIDDMQTQIYNLESDFDELEEENDKLSCELEDIRNILPNNTLIDLEKIEVLQNNWDKFTYENLNNIVTDTLTPYQKVMKRLNDEISNLAWENERLNIEIGEKEDEYETLKDEYDDYIDGSSDEVYYLERKYDELVNDTENTLLPNNTLVDLEKIEYLREYWEHFTYDDLIRLINIKI